MTFRDGLRGVLIPLAVVLVVLVAAGLGAFIWTATYVHSVASGAQLSKSAARTRGKAARPPSPTSPATLATLLGKVHGAVWEVNTFDANGQPSVGSAFAVVSSANQTLLLTSYAVVSAATFQPAPSIEVRQGSVSKPVTLRTWDVRHDLALLVLDKGNQSVLHGPAVNPPQPVQQVYAVSGAGGPNGSITTGKLSPASTATGLVDDAPQHNASRGGPLVDASGSALGVDSLAFMPPQLVTSSAGAHFAVPIQDACTEVLVCPGDTFPSS